MKVNLTVKTNSTGTTVTGDVDMTDTEKEFFGLIMLSGVMQSRPTLTPNEALSRAKAILEAMLAK